MLVGLAFNGIGAARAQGADWPGDAGEHYGVATPISQAQADPDLKDLMAAGLLPEMTLGKPNALVTVVEYASLGCALCRAFHKVTFPRFKQEYIDTGKVYFVFREFPIGKSSVAAAMASRCVPDKRFFTIIRKFMNSTGRWNAREPNLNAIYKVVQETGLSRSAFDTCMANQNIKDGVTQVKQRGRSFGVKGTPTFFINGKRVRGALTFSDMKKLVDVRLVSARDPK
ncbi:MAG: DsbA family protein [Alphaproteobacteria bacterium]